MHKCYNGYMSNNNNFYDNTDFLWLPKADLYFR